MTSNDSKSIFWCLGKTDLLRKKCPVIFGQNFETLTIASASLKKKTHLDGPTNENVLTILENRSLLLENARITLWLEFPNSLQKV